MQNPERAESSRDLRLLPARLPRRRLYQGCAVLLLLPTAAAFLPVQGRVSNPINALIPVAAAAIAGTANAGPTGFNSSLALSSRPRQAARSSASPVFAAAHASIPAAASRKVSRLSGIASWYGNVLRGHRTASGERFDPEALTACHPTLPFGTLVRVINLVNRRSVVVRINDRGVLNPDRVIDLSSAAAEQLDMLHAGVAPVRLEVQTLLHGKPAAQGAPAEQPKPAADSTSASAS